jgi:hypothetical protein
MMMHMHGRQEDEPILDGGAPVFGVLDINQGETEDEMEEREGKADPMDGQDAVALVVFAVHLDVVV